MAAPEKTFAEYRIDGHLWITLASGEYYTASAPTNWSAIPTPKDYGRNCCS